MPFSIDLRTRQETDLWTFRKTPAALELQALLDSGNRNGYVQRLKELSIPDAAGRQRMFSRTKGVVYEVFDESEKMKLSVKFKVKGSVITWFFIAPMDRTHQSFRDLVFNTAAKAHASVQNSCETYYRGTNHYHLKVMHTSAEESDYNHNHYRTANDGPITPVEVYEHIHAFYAQADGRKFITTPEERDDIILKFALFWAEYDLDINYVALLFVEGGSRRIASLLEDIAKAGKLSPDQADTQLEKFFKSEHGRNMFKLAEQQGFPSGKKEIDNIKNFIKQSYRSIYQQIAPKSLIASSLDSDLEPHHVSSSVTTSSSSTMSSSMSTSPKESPTSSPSSKKSSPRDEYLSDKDQLLDDIDKAEYEAFASDLTKHCRSINKEILEDLTLDDFRKGLLLYHALRMAQQEARLIPAKDQRFHSDLTTDKAIKEMIKQLPSLQQGSTEDDLGAPLLNQLVRWVTTASPKLDQWVQKISVHGSRGLGAEIALVRLANGQVDLRQAVPPEDRGTNSELAEINFDKVDLEKLFLPGGKKDSQSLAADELKRKLSDELKRLINNQKSEHPLTVPVFKAKLNVIQTALNVLSNKAKVYDLERAIKENDGWDDVTTPKMGSIIEKYVNEVFEMTRFATPTLKK